MALVLSEEQELLKSSAGDFLKENASVAQLRHLRDTNDRHGFDRSSWATMVEMGWSCLNIPEEYGGLDFGYTGLGQILEQTGRNLTASPLISTVLLGATAIKLGGSRAQKESLLPSIVAGELITALALEEGNHHKTEEYATTATLTDDSYRLSGEKTMVIDGHVADVFIVPANTVRGTELFIVDANAEGVSTQRFIAMDSRNYAHVVFDNVTIGTDTRLSKVDEGAALLSKILDIGRIGLAAEMLGGIQEAFERTVAYLKEREQFGVPIGSFQALQHRSALMFCEIEMCKSIVLKALQAIDNDSDDVSQLASLAKAKVGQVFQLVSNEAIQMHGGIGMTDDEEIGFYLKRARVAQRLLGDANFHLDRLAKMRGI